MTGVQTCALPICGYNRVAYSLCGGDRIDWRNPPQWAASPLGQRIAEADTVTATGNDAYLKFLRERGNRVNGE